MKRQFFVVLLLVSIFSIAFAVSETKDVKAIYNNIKIFIDGKYIQSKDSQGKVVEPFIVNGVTYVPVNIIPELTGKAVSWDGKTATISIGTQPNGTKVKTWLVDMVPTVSKGAQNHDYERHDGYRYTDLLLNTNIPSDNYGNSYFQGGLLSHRSWYVNWSQYPLEMKYTKLSGKLILTDAAKNTNDFHSLTVYSLFNNNKTVLYRSPKLTSGSRPVDVAVDVAGVVDLIIEFSTTNKDGRLTFLDNSVAFVEAGFE